MKKLFNLILLALFLLPMSANAQAIEADPATPAPINVHIFTQQGCPHCARTLVYLEELKKTEYPQIVVTDYDLKTNPEKYQTYVEFATAFNVFSTALTVPVTFVGDKVIFGEKPSDIRAAIETCKIKQCRDTKDIVAEYVSAHPEVQPAPANSSASIVGWIVLGVVGIAIIVFVINKFL
jgi:glutaredoxin